MEDVRIYHCCGWPMVPIKRPPPRVYAAVAIGMFSLIALSFFTCGLSFLLLPLLIIPAMMTDTFYKCQKCGREVRD